METNEAKIADVLLVEDNLGDIRLTQEALKEIKIKVNLSVVMDGCDAMAFLHKQGKHANAIRPDLILLDLNLPKKDGREVLKEIKSDPILKSIPVIVLTISQAEQDIQQIYNLYGNCYIRKPLDMNKFIEVIQTTTNFWFTVVSLPPKNTHE